MRIRYVSDKSNRLYKEKNPYSKNIIDTDELKYSLVLFFYLNYVFDKLVIYYEHPDGSSFDLRKARFYFKDEKDMLLFKLKYNL